MISKLQLVFNKIDAINATDPNMEIADGTRTPKELIYGIRMTEMLTQVEDSPSDLLQIAARGQHIRRWHIGRGEYPMDRKGYLKWRTNLKIFHGEQLAEIMKSLDYTEADMNVVKSLLMKNNLKSDQDAQTLEDVICLVFLKYYIDQFTVGKEEDKLIDILQKTWGKMSVKGQSAALKLSLSKPVKALIQKALTNG